jgi:DNA (cytosine-5)-methyltransferase 1
MIHFSLFSGIGGFDLASEWMGWKNYLSCEIADFPNKILEHYWPDAYHHRDVKTLNYETINNELSERFGKQWRDDDIILTGGFPCQPYSSAGKRLGKEDERHLWPEMLRIISEIKPKFIVGENVFGLLNWNGGMVFAEVCSDLEHQGYEITPVVIPAAAVNAPHGRDRVWFVAYRISKGLEGCTSKRIQTVKGGKNGFQDGISSRNVHDGFITNTNGTRVQGQSINTRTSKEIRQGWQSFTQTWNKWNIGRWQEFPTEPPICSGNDGLPDKLDGITFSKWRAESIKGYGNAIVPQVAFEIFKAIEKTYFDFQK